MNLNYSLQELFPKKDTTVVTQTIKDEPVLVFPASQEFIVHSSADDLRSQSYQYIMDQGKLLCPFPSHFFIAKIKSFFISIGMKKYYKSITT